MGKSDNDYKILFLKYYSEALDKAYNITWFDIRDYKKVDTIERIIKIAH